MGLSIVPTPNSAIAQALAAPTSVAALIAKNRGLLPGNVDPLAQAVMAKQQDAAQPDTGQGDMPAPTVVQMPADMAAGSLGSGSVGFVGSSGYPVNADFARALMQKGMGGGSIISPWDLAGRLAETGVGGWMQSKALKQAQDKEDQNTARLSAIGQAADPVAALLSSGDPDLIKLGIQQRLAASGKGQGTFRPLSDQEKAAWGIAPTDNSYGVGADGKPVQVVAAAKAANEPFTLTEGAVRYGPDGKPIATNPKADATKAPEPFTLGEGAVRYGPDGKPIASNPKPTPAPLTQPRPATTEEKAALSLRPDAPVVIDKDGMPHILSAGGVTVNNTGSIPVGWRMDYDEQNRPVSMSPIPNGPVDLEMKATAARAASAKGQTDANSGVVVQDVGRVIDLINSSPVPVNGLGALAQGIPGLPANDAARLIDTIKANAAFDKLQAMRNASPTGGALGQVSDNEGRLLAAAIGSLDLSQSKQQLVDNLKRVQNIYLDIIHGPGDGPPRQPLSFETPPPPAPTGAPAGPVADPLGIR